MWLSSVQLVTFEELTVDSYYLVSTWTAAPLRILNLVSVDRGLGLRGSTP
jgi:hypothetical protein